MSMPGVSQPIGPGSASHGLAQKQVRVQTVNPASRIATCIDSLGKPMNIRYDIMRSKGNMPEPGESWIVDRQIFNTWTFAAIITGTTDGVTVSTVNGLTGVIQTINDTADTNAAAAATTAAANYARRPTGSFEITLLPVAPAGALLLLGQVVNRADYPNLWAWVQANSGALLHTGLFGPANGTTTFGLPNLAGLVLRGVNTAASEVLGALIGSDSRVLSFGNLPFHGHTYTTDTVGTHDHPGSGALAAGVHGGHNSGSFGIASGTAGATSSNGNTSDGSHNHTLSLAGDGSHNHSGTTDGSGSGTAFDNRQASIGVNYMIWT